MGDAGGHVATNVLVGRMLEMRPVVEISSAASDSCRAAVVVDRNGMHTRVGEPEREPFVEAVEASDVGEDHDPRRVGSVGRRREGGEAVPIRGLQNDPSSTRAAGRRMHRGPRRGPVAHAWVPSGGRASSLAS